MALTVATADDVSIEATMSAVGTKRTCPGGLTTFALEGTTDVP
jgi:hypothetical protein